MEFYGGDKKRLPDVAWFRERIREAHGGNAPRVLDPFAGGGAIPLEAMRLGCEVVANDLNPVAWFILKCTLEYPQRLAGKTLPLPAHVMRDESFAQAFLKAQGFKGARLDQAVEAMVAVGRGEPRQPGMHDDARVNRVGKSAVDDMLLDEIKAAKWLDAGASTLGARVHKLPTGPDQVPSDGEFRYVILGPIGQSESGKPSALAARFCEEVTGPQNPRSAKNAIVIAAPDRAGMAQAQEKVKDYLAWLEVKAQLSGQPVDPVRSSMLDSAVSGAKKDIADAIRQAYCIVVTRGTDDSVNAFKVTVDPTKPLFTTIKEDPKSRITDVALAPDALLPGSGSGFDLWREDEDKRRVKTIVGAFAERPKLPKMLRRSDLLDTVANGCEQGLFVLSLQRPDGSARTWWRTQINEEALNDDALEAVQNPVAVLDAIEPSLLVPGKLEGLDWKNGIKVADLISYFDGYVLTIDHAEEGWTEQKPIPRCPESKIIEAVGAAVKASSCWLTSGTASVWGEVPPPGIVSKTAVLRISPQPIDVSSLTPEALPDAWTGGKATAHSIEQAVAAQRGVTSMPWKVVETAIRGPRRMTLSRCDRRLTSNSCLISSKIGDRTLHRFV